MKQIKQFLNLLVMKAMFKSFNSKTRQTNALDATVKIQTVCCCTVFVSKRKAIVGKIANAISKIAKIKKKMV